LFRFAPSHFHHDIFHFSSHFDPNVSLSIGSHFESIDSYHNFSVSDYHDETVSGVISTPNVSLSIGSHVKSIDLYHNFSVLVSQSIEGFRVKIWGPT
jgi:hypothetical protein